MIEYFAANLWQFWAIIALLCLVVELSSGDFFIMCFSIGAFAAAATAPFGLPFVWQVVVFVAASVLSLLFVRPAMLRYFHRSDRERVSNADAIIGREGTVSQAIEEGGYGRVAIDGDDWKAVTADRSAAERGDRVRVVGRESIIITVEKIL